MRGQKTSTNKKFGTFLASALGDMLSAFSFLASPSFSSEDLSLAPAVVGRSSVDVSSTFFFLPLAAAVAGSLELSFDGVT